MELSGSILKSSSNRLRFCVLEFTAIPSSSPLSLARPLPLSTFGGLKHLPLPPAPRLPLVRTPRHRHPARPLAGMRCDAKVPRPPACLVTQLPCASRWVASCATRLLGTKGHLKTRRRGAHRRKRTVTVSILLGNATPAVAYLE